MNKHLKSFVSYLYLITFANDLRRSLFVVPVSPDGNIRRRSSEVPEVPEPPLVLIAVFLIITSSIYRNLTG